MATTSAMNCASMLVWAAAAVAAGVVITRFLTTRQQARRGNGAGLTGKRSPPR
ncbi:hypothetical protein DFQ14_102443 [Halopolyspora algeriensis]|uniref:Uncharacterized protein n=1 Tax=Halopolyspora algeriensis TaxID=1500506 RepID=A0A368W0N0_9ACTN|nr:hypothetical protein [Halopolyspora algeriensis]RCW46141.1 hypothetical protein DFQ14_102443 [Halopolyspora algeriensis]TQM55544.1 hypothetical protein FHU43_0318 [Halopolyspora algeriensis]